jgi:hypothetical protein
VSLREPRHNPQRGETEGDKSEQHGTVLAALVDVHIHAQGQQRRHLLTFEQELYSSKHSIAQQYSLKLYVNNLTRDQQITDILGNRCQHETAEAQQAVVKTSFEGGHT